MPGTFSNDLGVVQDAEVVANYVVVGGTKTNAALNNDFLLEGTNCITSGISRATSPGTGGLMGFLPTTGSLSLTAVPGTPAFTRAAGSFITDGFRPGTKFVTTGFTNGGNNATWTVSAVVALTLTVTAAGGMISETATAVASSVADVTASNKHFFFWLKLLMWPGSATHEQGGQRLIISSTASPSTVRCVNKAVVAAGGLNYVVNDVLTLSGGTQTQAAQVTVTAVSGGAVTTVSPVASARGLYTALPSNPISTTGGTGSGCTLTVAGTGQSATDGGDPGDWIYTGNPSLNWYVGGNNTVVVEGWVPYVLDPNSTPDLKAGTVTLTAINRVGEIRTAKNTSTIATHAADVSHYGTGITVNDGTSGSPVTFADFLAYDNATTRALGLITSLGGIYYLGGKLYIGTTGQSALTYFKDTSQTLVFQGFPVATTFYEIVLAGASGNTTTFQLGNYSNGLVSSGVTIKGANRYTTYGGVATGLVTSIWTLTASAANQTLNLYGCTLSEMLSAALASTTTWRGSTITNSGTITANGSLIDNCTFQDLRTTAPISASYCVDATTSSTITNCTFVNAATALKWTCGNPLNTKLDGTTFISGGTGHAIELVGTATNQVLTNVTFSGYAASDGSTGNEAIYVNTASGSMSITITGGTVPSIRAAAGVTVTVIANARTFSVTAKDLDTGVIIENARVMVPVTDNANFPYNASVSITGAGTTATVTHATHGRATGDNILIAGATRDEYNGAYTITLDGGDPTNKYTYTTPATVSGSPAGGSTTATMVLLNGFTNASGVITDSRTYSAAQPVSGWVRRHTYGPSYTSATWTESTSTLTKTGAFTGFPGTFLLTITAGTNMTPGVYLATYVNANSATLPGGAGSADSSDVAFIIGAKPLYRQAPVADTVSVTNGLSVTVFLQPDE